MSVFTKIGSLAGSLRHSDSPNRSLKTRLLAVQRECRAPVWCRPDRVRHPYRVVSYSVARRRNEIGIWMALGAQRSQLLKLIVRESIAPVVIGLTAGAAAACFSGERFAACCSASSQPIL